MLYPFWQFLPVLQLFTVNASNHLYTAWFKMNFQKGAQNKRRVTSKCSLTMRRNMFLRIEPNISFVKNMKDQGYINYMRLFSKMEAPHGESFPMECSQPQ